MLFPAVGRRGRAELRPQIHMMVFTIAGGQLGYRQRNCDSELFSKQLVRDEAADSQVVDSPAGPASPPPPAVATRPRRKELVVTPRNHPACRRQHT